MTDQHEKTQSEPHTRHLLAIQKAKLPRKATLALQQRPRRENAAQRARHFLRIDKGGEA